MASGNLERTIEIIFSATDDMSPQVTALSSGLESLADSGKSLVGGLASATDVILKLDAAIIGLGAVVLGFAFKEAVEFEDALTDLQSVMTDAEGTATQFRDEFVSLSDRFGISTSDIAKNTAAFRQSNFSLADSLTLVESSLTQTRISQLSMDESTQTLIRTLRGFALPVTDASKVIDIFAEINDNANVSVDELARAFADVAPTAKQLGLSVEQTAGFLTPLIERLGSGSSAVQVLSAGFVKLLDPSKEARTALDEVGISQRKSNGEFLSGLPLLESVQKGFNGLTSEQQLYVAGTLAGTRQAKLFVDVLKDTDGQQRIVALATESAGKAQGELAEKLALSRTALERFAVILESTAESVGEQFRPQLTSTVDATSELLRAFRDVVDSGGLQPLFALLRPLIDSFTASINDIARLLPEAFTKVDFTGIADAFGGIGDSLSGIFDGADLSSADGLAKVLQTIVDVGEALIRVTGGIIESFAPLLSTFVDGSDEAAKFGRDVGESVGNILGVAKQLDTFGPLLTGLVSSVGVLSTALNVLWAAQSLAGASSLTTFAKQIGEFGTSLIVNGVESVKSFGTALNSLDNVATKAGILTFVAGLSFELTTLATRSEIGQQAITSIVDVLAEITGVADAERDALANTSAEFTKLADASDKAADALEPQTEEFVSLSAATREAAEKVVEFSTNSTIAGAGDDLTESITRVNKSLSDLASGDTSGSGVIDMFSAIASESETAADATKGYVRTIDDGVVVFEQFGTEGVRSAKKIVNATDEARKKADEFLLKLREIESEERIKRFEIVADVKIAALEADAEKLKAISESLSESFASTGDVISAAFGALDSVGGAFAQEKLGIIQDQLEKENKLRERTAELQEEQTRAVIEEIQARTDAIRDGEGIIKIQADGLEPEIEAFMFKILERIQIRATESQSAFLLGV